MILCTAVCMYLWSWQRQHHLTHAKTVITMLISVYAFLFNGMCHFHSHNSLYHSIVSVYLVSKKSCNQGAVDVTEDEPDQNNNQVFYKRSGEGISDEHELIQQQRETKRKKKK